MATLTINKFGGLDRSGFPADASPNRAEEMHDFVVTKRGGNQALSKRDGYKVVVPAVAEYDEGVEITERSDPGGAAQQHENLYLPPHKRMLVYDKALDGTLGDRKSIIAGVIHEYYDDNIDNSTKNYVELLLYYSNDGGDTWNGSYYDVGDSTTYADITLRAWPDLTNNVWDVATDFELDIDDTYLYVISYLNGYWDSSGSWTAFEDVRVFRIPLTDIRDSSGTPETPGAVLTNLVQIRDTDSVTTGTTTGGHGAVGKYVSITHEPDGSRFFIAYVDTSAGDLVVIPDYSANVTADPESITWSGLTTISDVGNDLEFPLVRWNDDSALYALALLNDDGTPNIALYGGTAATWIAGTPTPSNPITGITMSGANSFGFEYLPLAETGGNSGYCFAFLNSSTQAIVAWGSYTSTLTTDTDAATFGRFGLAPVVDNTLGGDPYARLVAWYCKSNDFAATDVIYARVYRHKQMEDGTVPVEMTYHSVTHASQNVRCFGFVMNTYMDRSGASPYGWDTDNFKLGGLYIRKRTDGGGPASFNWAFKYAEQFTTITIEALTQDWFEEDGTLQLTAQASDDHLYRIRLNDTTDPFIWRLLETDETGLSFAAGGGRFRNEKGIIRMAAGGAPANDPDWYGYIDRGYFADRTGDAQITQAARVQEKAHLSNLGGASIDIFSMGATNPEDGLGSLPQGSYQYRHFVQFDGFQYGLPGNIHSLGAYEIARAAADNANATDVTATAEDCRVTVDAGLGVSAGEYVWISNGAQQGKYEVAAFAGTNLDLWSPDGSMDGYTFNNEWYDDERYGKVIDLDGAAFSSSPDIDGAVRVSSSSLASASALNDVIAISTDGVNDTWYVHSGEGSGSYVDLTLYTGGAGQTAVNTGVLAAATTPLGTGAFGAKLYRFANNTTAADQGGTWGNVIIQIPATAHGLTTGQSVECTGFVAGGTDIGDRINGNTYEIIDVPDANNVVLDTGSTGSFPAGSVNCNGGYLTVQGDLVTSKATYIYLKITDADEMSKRISAVGMLRRYRAPEATAWGAWEVLGIADIKDGMKDSPFFVGRAPYVVSSNYLQVNAAVPEPLKVAGSATFITALNARLREDDGSEHEASITSTTAAGELVLNWAGSGESVEPATDQNLTYELISRWYYDGTDSYVYFFDPALNSTWGTYEELSGFSTELESIDANYRDRCVVNDRVFVAGVTLDPDGEADVQDDTVFTAPQTGDGVFTEDAFPASAYLKFGRGDGDNIQRILAHNVGTDEGGIQAEVLLIIKQASMYMIDVSGLSTNWSQLRQFPGPGAVGRDAVVQVDQVVYALGHGELYMVQGLTVQRVPSFRRLDGIVDDFTETQYRGAVLGYVGGQYDWLFVSFPDRDGSNYTTFVWDRKVDEWYEFRYANTPKMFVRGIGYDTEIEDDPDLTGRIFFSDGDYVCLAQYGSADGAATFTAQWKGLSIGFGQPFSRKWLNRIAAGHYTAPSGANGTVTAKDESDNTVASLTLTAVNSPGSGVPQTSDKEILDGHGKSLQVTVDAAAAATRAQLDVLQMDLEEIPDTM